MNGEDFLTNSSLSHFPSSLSESILLLPQFYLYYDQKDILA